MYFQSVLIEDAFFTASSLEGKAENLITLLQSQKNAFVFAIICIEQSVYAANLTNEGA